MGTPTMCAYVFVSALDAVPCALCPVPSWSARGSAAGSSDRIRMIDLQPLVPLPRALPLALAIPNLGAPCRVTQQFPSKSGVAPAPPSPHSPAPKNGPPPTTAPPSITSVSVSAARRRRRRSAARRQGACLFGPRGWHRARVCVCVCVYVRVHVSRFLCWFFSALHAR